MFFEKWSHKVTLPMGARWGNNVGGVAACLNWSRPPIPPPKHDSFMEVSTHRPQEAFDGRYTPVHTHRPYKGTARKYQPTKTEDFPLAYSNTIYSPDPGYYPAPAQQDTYDRDLNVLVIGRESRASSALGMRPSLKQNSSNEEALLEKLKALTQQHDTERKVRMLERNAKSRSRKLAFERSLNGGETPGGKGYGFMGPPPKRLNPTPPASRNRPAIPRPHTSAGKTETYRYTEREIVIEDMDDNKKRTVRKDVRARPSSQQGYSTYTTPQPRYATTRYTTPPHQHYDHRSTRPALFASERFNYEVDNFSPTPLVFQTRELDRPMSKAEFVRSRAKTPQQALTAYEGQTGNKRYGERKGSEAVRVPSVSKTDENITIHVDCAKLVGAKRAKSVTVRLHGVDSGDAENIKVLTVPNSAGSK